MARSNMTRRLLTGAAALVLCSFTGLAPAAGQVRALAASTVASSPLTAISYSLIRDVGGPAVRSGDTITLTFGPAGTVYLLATRPGGDLGIAGAWSYAAGKVTLSFTANGFRRHAAFTPNLRASRIRIPFQVFSGKAGASIWAQTAIDPIQGAYQVAYAIAAESSDGVPMAQMVSAAGSYIAGITGAKLSTTASSSGAAGRDVLSHGPGRVRLETFATDQGESGGGTLNSLRRPMSPVDSNNVSPKIQSVAEMEGGLKLLMENRQQITVILGTFDQPGGSALPLMAAPLAGDPRVHLHADPPGINTDDPPAKSALFIDPFDNTRYIGWTIHGKDYLPSVRALSNSGVLKTEISDLTSDGYSIKQLTDTGATVEGIIRSLRPSPGVLMVETHGGTDGSLATGQYLGSNATMALANLAAIQGKISAEFGMPAGIAKTAIGGGSVPSIGGARYFVTLLPAFWSWMENSRGLDLSHSLVYIGACYTDRNPALREAIKARAYFAFQQEMFTGLVNATGDYLIQMLYRPTVTAEEAYYNMIRVDQTSSMIYVEDTAFKGDLFPQAHLYNDKPVRSAILGVLYAYGYDGHIVMPYLNNGWLGKGIDQGQIWWLVFATRWGQDTKSGVQNLLTCYNTFWKKHQLGGLQYPFCQNANDGSVPTKDEVNYAIYLVSGKRPGGPIKAVPRFTLNDGR